MYPGYELYDDFEEDRLEHLQIAKSRGKGAPKKKNSKNGEFVFLGRRGEGDDCGFVELTLCSLLQKREGDRRRSVRVEEVEEERDTPDGWLLGMDVQMDWVTGAWRLFLGRERVGMCSCFV